MDKDLKQALQRAVSQLPHKDAQSLWEEPVSPMPEHDFITRQDLVPSWPRRRSSPLRLVMAVVFVCLLCAGGFAWYWQNLAPNMRIGLDINPSMEITTNRKDEVLSIRARNAEGEQLLVHEKYRGWDVTETVETLVASLQRDGYLSEANNVVLVTVNGRDDEEREAMAQSLSDTIRATVDRADTPTSVLYQSGATDDDLRAQAEAYHVSLGKLSLAQALSAALPDYDLKQLLDLSPEALLRLLEGLEDEVPADIQCLTSRFLDKSSEQTALPSNPPTSTDTSLPAPPTHFQPTPPPETWDDDDDDVEDHEHDDDDDEDDPDKDDD